MPLAKIASASAYRGPPFGTLATRIVAQKLQRWCSCRVLIACSGVGQKSSRFVALSNFSKSLFVNAGLPDDRIVVKPNFVRCSGDDGHGGRANGVGAVFVGRLSPEKDVGTLVEAWASIDAPLRIIGDGPLLEPLKAAADSRVTFQGSLKHDEVFSELRNSAFVVVPSIWYEPFGLAVVEAFSVARPVIASRSGSLEEIVEDGVTGLLFSPGDKADLESKMRWALAHPDEMRLMGQRARKVYEEKYSSEANYRHLIEVYDAAGITSRRQFG